MFGRKKPPRLLGTNTPEVRHFRRQLAKIEWDLKSWDPHNPEHIAEIRRLTNDHAVYRDCLREHGVIHPAPLVKW